MAKPKLNIPLLFRIQAELAEEPRKYRQSCWARSVDADLRGNPPCGTVGCIAGWAVFLTRPRDKWQRYIQNVTLLQNTARKVLGLTEGEALIMFDGNNQVNLKGEEGVKSMNAKILAILTDRAMFAKKKLSERF